MKIAISLIILLSVLKCAETNASKKYTTKCTITVKPKNAPSEEKKPEETTAEDKKEEKAPADASVNTEEKDQPKEGE